MITCNFFSGLMSLLKDITSFYCSLLYKPLSYQLLWCSFKNVWMALTFLHFFHKVFHHVHKEMLHLAFKVLSLEIINLRGRFILSMAFVCSWSCCVTQQCYFVHIKRKTRKLHNCTLLHVLTNIITLWVIGGLFELSRILNSFSVPRYTENIFKPGARRPAATHLVS